MKAKFVSNEVKYPTTTLTLLTVPEGYMLVEFFGTHDFGWLREDSTVPMTLDEILTVPGGIIGIVCYTFNSYLFLLLFLVVMVIICVVCLLFSLPQTILLCDKVDTDSPSHSPACISVHHPLL
jgi:hypothetical protein